MNAAWKRAVAAAGKQYGAITRAQLLRVGLPSTTVSRMLGDGRLLPVHHGVYRLGAIPWSAPGRLLAACLATGGWASHESAAWLWGLVDRPPPTPSVSVGASARNVRPGIRIHRKALVLPWAVGSLHRIPCTRPTHTLLDLAAVADEAVLDAAADRAMARKLLTLADLVTAVDAPGRRGRPGTGAMRAALTRRGMLGAPNPSVLESRMLRLLIGADITPVSCEQRIDIDGWHYRIDIELAPKAGIEVDGFATHFTPEARERDYRRRNRLTRSGRHMLYYTWIDVTHDGPRVLEEVRGLLAEVGAA